MLYRLAGMGAMAGKSLARGNEAVCLRSVGGRMVLAWTSLPKSMVL